jgi:hypothetical protein
VSPGLNGSLSDAWPAAAVFSPATFSTWAVVIAGVLRVPPAGVVVAGVARVMGDGGEMHAAEV